MTLLTSALLAATMSSSYPGPWVEYNNLASMGGSVSPASLTVVEHSLFSNTLTAIDTDTYRREVSLGNFEESAFASTRHYGLLGNITSASESGPLVQTGYDGNTGTYTYHHTKRAMDTGPLAQIVRYDDYHIMDAAPVPAFDVTAPKRATIIITGDMVAEPPGGGLPPGEG